MGNRFKKIIEILDGTPAEYGQREKGQSVVELALVTPILIVLLAGIVEIGYFANNYLIVMEVTRVGARSATTLIGDLSLEFWDDSLSYAPDYPWTGPLTDTDAAAGGEYESTSAERAAVREFADLAAGAADLGFYTSIGLLMRTSMDPLFFGASNVKVDATGTPIVGDFNNTDEIVVSVFSLAVIDPAEIPSGYTGSMDVVPTGGPQVVVVGRYPHNTNECTVSPSGVATAYERDPFDFYVDSAQNLVSNGDPFDELDGYDAGAEYQRGFVWRGVHDVDGNPYCRGSEFLSDDIEALFNLPSFSLSDPQREYLPSQGVVLVEMFWRHDLLLKFPAFGTVFDTAGEDRTDISAWAAFPLQAAEPNITFN